MAATSKATNRTVPNRAVREKRKARSDGGCPLRHAAAQLHARHPAGHRNRHRRRHTWPPKSGNGARTHDGLPRTAPLWRLDGESWHLVVGRLPICGLPAAGTGFSFRHLPFASKGVNWGGYGDAEEIGDSGEREAGNAERRVRSNPRRGVGVKMTVRRLAWPSVTPPSRSGD
jgi:hypothetical protein